MIEHDLDRVSGVLTIHPQGALERADFEAVAAEVDPFIAEHGGLAGLLIDAPSFPGWSDFAALVSHLRFVREHHRAIRRVALVSDSAALSVAPSIAGHFVAAEVRHFDTAGRDAALAWLRAA